MINRLYTVDSVSAVNAALWKQPLQFLDSSRRKKVWGDACATDAEQVQPIHPCEFRHGFFRNTSAEIEIQEIQVVDIAESSHAGVSD